MDKNILIKNFQKEVDKSISINKQITDLYIIWIKNQMKVNRYKKREDKHKVHQENWKKNNSKRWKRYYKKYNDENYKNNLGIKIKCDKCDREIIKMNLEKHQMTNLCYGRYCKKNLLK